MSVALAGLYVASTCVIAESLTPLPGNSSPQSIGEVWSAYAPEAEPLDVEIVSEWEEDGVEMRILRYRIGVFKGQKSMMMAIYGFPKGGSDLPGLVQVHGGGQSASTVPCLVAAKRGYACISLNWRGERLFGVKKQPEINTDWGAVAGKQESAARGIKPGPRKYDPMPSGRNEGFFLRTLAARRALTFLAQQPEVDGERLGIYGHSMGGIITMQTAAIDPRVKAAAPSAGPNFPDETRGKIGDLTSRTATPRAYIEKLDCPVLFMNPANDFHGKIETIETIVEQMPSRDYRLARVPHLNHRDKMPFLANIPLWFDYHLKGGQPVPETPHIELALRGEDGRPFVSVTPDSSDRAIQGVDVYFTRHGPEPNGQVAKKRYWHHIELVQAGSVWSSSLDLLDTDRPLWVYANVHYKLDEPVAWHSYYYSERPATETLSVSSRLIRHTAKELQEAKVLSSREKGPVIEDFGAGWRKRWYTFDKVGTLWPIRSLKLTDPAFRAGKTDQLVLELTSPKPGVLVFGYDDYHTVVPVQGAQRETISLAPSDFVLLQTGEVLSDWAQIKHPELVIGDDLRVKNTKGKKVSVGEKWRGEIPEFHELRWEPAE